MDRCSIEIDLLKDENERDLWTFRWVWIFNFAALILGIFIRDYVLVAVCSVTAMTAIVGIGRIRQGRRILNHFISVCLGQPRPNGNQSNNPAT